MYNSMYDRPTGSGGGQPAGPTIGSILRMALKAYVGGGMSGAGAGGVADMAKPGMDVAGAGTDIAMPGNDVAASGGFNGGQIAGGVVRNKMNTQEGNQTMIGDRSGGYDYRRQPLLNFQQNPYGGMMY